MLADCWKGLIQMHLRATQDKDRGWSEGQEICSRAKETVFEQAFSN